MEKHYRKCAGIVLLNEQNKVLVCARIDNKINHWQFPQGGIEAGETSLEAAKRELREETSVTSTELIVALEEPLRYDFPDSIRKRFFHRHIENYGQDMYWCLFKFTGHDEEINLNTEHPEFKAYEWVEIEEATKRIVPFKRRVYQQMTEAFRPFIK